jgi:2-polyprenyl-6-methoxyphenol hydroxylase-like FAD-dependent oxidoreductase
MNPLDLLLIAAWAAAFGAGGAGLACALLLSRQNRRIEAERLVERRLRVVDR